LIYVFNTYMIDRMARHLSSKYPPLDLLKRRRIRLLAIDYHINPDKFPEVFHGIARYHSKLTYTEKRFIERLVREGYIHTLLATSALGVGVNLPFKWVLFGSLSVYMDEKNIPISKIDFVQLSGRAGRVGYFDEGYVGVLEHGFIEEDTVDLYRKLLSKELEEPQIKLEIDVWSVVKGERTLEEEVEYVCRYSLPEMDKKEVSEQAQEIEKKLSSISEKEREFLKEFYQPELSLDENIRLAKFITHKVGDPIEIYLFALPVGRKEKEIDYLLLLRRIGKRLNGQKWEGKTIEVKDMQEVEKQIKALDPLVLEVLT
ncbi:MAG: helicase-related protein, partial [Hydrogenobacter sp.]